MKTVKRFLRTALAIVGALSIAEAVYAALVPEQYSALRESLGLRPYADPRDTRKGVKRK